MTAIINVNMSITGCKKTPRKLKGSGKQPFPIEGCAFVVKLGEQKYLFSKKYPPTPTPSHPSCSALSPVLVPVFTWLHGPARGEENLFSALVHFPLRFTVRLHNCQHWQARVRRVKSN